MDSRLRNHLRQGILLSRDDLRDFLLEQREAAIVVHQRHLDATSARREATLPELSLGWGDPAFPHPMFDGPGGMLLATLVRAVEQAEEFWRDEDERWAAWFADVATLAVRGILDGAGVSPVRALAGAPSAQLSVEDVEALGLRSRVYHQELGATVPAVGDALLEQLWPDSWAVHGARLPTLPAPDQLRALLAAATSEHGMSHDVVDRIQSSHARVLDSLAAADEARRLENEGDEPDLVEDPRAAECWARFDRRHEHLIDYATAITGWV